MRITRWGEYGVLCTLVLAGRAARGESVTTASDIAEENNIAVDYAQQILQRLKRGNVVVSERGPRGGYRLARSEEEITLRDILCAAEGETFELMCENSPLDPERCSGSRPCVLRGVWKEFHDHIDEFLAGYSLADLRGKFQPDDVIINLGGVSS